MMSMAMMRCSSSHLDTGKTMPFNHAYALTGSIATGKSTVVKAMTKAGLAVIDADKVAHEALDEASADITEIFGKTFVKEGKVDRKALGALVFSDPEKRKALEALLHPVIYEKILEAADVLDEKGEPYIVDIPLFYEGGRYAIENVIVVYAAKAQQLERLMQREGFSKEEALSRINAQIDIEIKRKKASFVIDNSDTLLHLSRQTEKMIHTIRGASL